VCHSRRLWCHACGAHKNTCAIQQELEGFQANATLQGMNVWGERETPALQMMECIEKVGQLADTQADLEQPTRLIHKHLPVACNTCA
jgi:hypothetical protein